VQLFKENITEDNNLLDEFKYKNYEKFNHKKNYESLSSNSKNDDIFENSLNYFILLFMKLIIENIKNINNFEFYYIMDMIDSEETKSFFLNDIKSFHSILSTVILNHELDISNENKDVDIELQQEKIRNEFLNQINNTYEDDGEDENEIKKRDLIRNIFIDNEIKEEENEIEKGEEVINNEFLKKNLPVNKSRRSKYSILNNSLSPNSPKTNSRASSLSPSDEESFDSINDDANNHIDTLFNNFYDKNENVTINFNDLHQNIPIIKINSINDIIFKNENINFNKFDDDF
jgi:hypothetical protein